MLNAAFWSSKPSHRLEQEDTKNAARRDRSIRLAVVTSFLSKAGTGLLQLLAIPIAVRVLGREEFGIYTSISLALATVSLLEIGVGPALAHGLSKANAQGDEKAMRVLSSTAFFMMLSLAAVAGLALTLVLNSLPLATLFGADYAGKEAVMRPALWLGLGLFLCLFVLNLSDRMREGQLEVAQTNLWGAAGNLVAALAVGIGVIFVPQVWYLVLAIHGSVVLAKLANTISLWKKHPCLIPSLRYLKLEMVRHLFSDGLAFSSCFLLTVIVEYNLCGWMVGQVLGPSEVALYGVFISLTVMQLGFVMMLSTPTWPAVAEALARGDLIWARKAAKKLYLYGTAFGICSAIGLIVLGPWGLGVWLGDKFSGVERTVLVAYAFYFAAHVWRHLNHALMIGVGQVKRLARVQFLETGVLAVAAWFALNSGGVGAMLVAMAVSIISITGWVLPRMVRRALGEGASQLPR